MPAFPDMDTDVVVGVLVHLFVAYALALPVAWDRERHARSAGLRTFPLVAIATCGYTLVAREVFGTDLEAQSRVVGGLVAGMGFIGGGAILKIRGTVEGTATAAALWATGAIGVSVAVDRWEIAIALTLTTLITFVVMSPNLKRRMGGSDAPVDPKD